MLAAVLERLAEREAEVITVGVLQLRLCLVVSHPLEFSLREAIGLHVGEAPIRLTEIGSELDRLTVGGDGRCGLAVGFVGVSQRLVQLGVARHLLQQRAVALDGARNIAQGHHDPGVGHPHARIGWLGGHQPLGLFACALVLVQVDEGEHKVVARRVVARRLRQQLIEQHLGVGVVLEVTRDHGEHAQRLRIVRMLGEMRTDGALGVLVVAVGDHGTRGDHRLRQGCECRDMAGRVRGVCGPADDPIELLERLPAGGQGGVVADGPLEGLEGFRGIALRDMAVTALLEQPRVARMERLQRGECAERLRKALQHALRDCDQIQQVPMAAVLAEVGVRDLQHLGIATPPERGAQHQQRRLEVGQCRGVG